MNGGGTEAWVPVAVYRSTSSAAMVKKEQIVLERDSGPRPVARKEEKDSRKVATDTRSCWSCGKTGHNAANCTKESWNRSLNAVEDKSDISEEVHEDDDELHAWCLLEESENEQWQEVMSEESELKLKKLAHEPLLRVENNSCASPRKVIDVKDNWVNIRATMDTGAAGHGMRAEMFPRVKLVARPTKKFVAANGEKSRTRVRKPYHSSPLKECTCAHIQECVRCEPLDLNEQGRASWQRRGAGCKESAHSNQSRRHSHQAGREQRGVHHGHVGCASMKLFRFSAGKDTEWLECYKQTCKTKDEVQ